MKALLAVFAIVLSVPIFAQDNELVLWSGGVSFDEREQAPTVGTKLVFFIETGSFLTNIKVSVSSESGEELVELDDTGPWLILDLPDGKYSVIAERSNGDIQSAIINVDSSITAEFSFRFPNNED